MEPTAVVVVAAVTLAAGIAAGRLLAPSARSLRALEGRLEAARKERETAEGALARARDDLGDARRELDATRRELEDYRGRVAHHFTGTSERLRELAIQYRAVYQHLADGAADLCPEGFVGLAEGGLDFLPDAPPSPSEPAAPEAPATPEPGADAGPDAAARGAEAAAPASRS